MQIITVSAVSAAVAALVTAGFLSRADNPEDTSYGEDRVAIEDLQARYLFALDFHDPDLYVPTFAEDGVLDYGSGEVQGRAAIKEVIAGMPSPAPVEGMRAGAARHNVSNIVIRVDGDSAESRSYWFHYSNDNPERRGVFDGFGHYEDQLVRVDGEWLFSKRTIYNEGSDAWAYPETGNPAW
jgi:hypothetical protein